MKFCWIPGNERADSAANVALCLPVTGMKLPACELIPRVSKFCLEELQDIWNSAANNKLHAIYPVVGILCHSNLTSRREAVKLVIINRLKIGHSIPLNSLYLPSGKDQNQHVRPAMLHWQWCIYFWIVRTYRTSGRNTSLLLLGKTLSKTLTTKRSLVLSKMLILP